jgi:hypothetical protein
VPLQAAGMCVASPSGVGALSAAVPTSHRPKVNVARVILFTIHKGYGQSSLALQRKDSDQRPPTCSLLPIHSIVFAHISGV